MSNTGFRFRMITAAVIGTLVASGLSAPAQASDRFTASAHARARQSAVTTVRVRVAATATATAGSPPMQARVTVRVWATATGRATRTASATVRRSGATPAKARAAAKYAARSTARHRAASRARAVARMRALSAARALGQRRANAAAEQAAMKQARTLAATAARTSAPAGCTALPKAGGGTWQCTFDEEFNGTRLDPTKWQPLTSAATGLATGNTCFVDSPSNISVGGGVLTLTARKLAAPMTCPLLGGGSISTAYTGGQIGTSGRFAQTYGRFAVRAKFPAATVAGLQSSLWMWPQNGSGGEIDIAEWYSQYPDRVIPYLHYAYDTSSVATSDPLTGTNVVTNDYYYVKDVNAFHEYAAEWTPTTITILIDGHTVLTDRLAPSGPSPFDQPFFLLLTACLGSGTNAFDPQTTPLPATTQIDWVRAWK